MVLATIVESSITPTRTHRFALIYADPPWSFETYSEKGKDMTSPDNHYPTMSYEAIAGIRIDGYTIPQIAAKDAVRFMWCTSANLEHAIATLTAWGFEYKTNLTWDKQRTGTGYWVLNQHQHLLLGTRGSPPMPMKKFPSLFRSARGKHSEKLAAVREIIEIMFPFYNQDSRIELFARGEVPGWSVHGNEALEALGAAACCAGQPAQSSNRCISDDGPPSGPAIIGSRVFVHCVLSGSSCCAPEGSPGRGESVGQPAKLSPQTLWREFVGCGRWDRLPDAFKGAGRRCLLPVADKEWRPDAMGIGNRRLQAARLPVRCSSVVHTCRALPTPRRLICASFANIAHLLFR
jgi:N6-adenosine-specific RNA methylase IME4